MTLLLQHDNLDHIEEEDVEEDQNDPSNLEVDELPHVGEASWRIGKV